MRKILIIILILMAAGSVFGSPLVFSATKEIKTLDENKFAELVTFDTSKFKELRVGVLSADDKESRIVWIEAVENTNFIFIMGFDIFPSRSVSIDAPPSKIRITARNIGTYKVFIWAQ